MENTEAAINPGTKPGPLGRAVALSAEGEQQSIASNSSAGKPVVDRMTASAHEAVDRVSSVASHAVDTIGLKEEQISAAEKRLVAGTSRYVKEHPVTSLGIAIATGYFLSRIFASR
jgi:ElaB/YqjD/DUF883 family membrane-anchored ribosome-binding protein